MSQDIQALSTEVDTDMKYRSDHSLIYFRFNLFKGERERGYWKFNTSLLKDKNYISLIKSTVDENIKRYIVPDDQSERSQTKFLVNDQLFFETLKIEIRGKTISYSSF